MQITTQIIKELRNSTGISVMQCKKALEEADGDLEKALIILKKNSSNIALKKSDRNTNSGSLIIKQEKNKTILLALHCETDFVSKNEDFMSLLNELSEIALKDGILEMKKIAPEKINLIIQKTGENIQLGEIIEVMGEITGNYIHNNKIGVIVALEKGNIDLAKDIAMHVAAMKPEYIFPEEIKEETKKNITEIFEKELATIDKSPEIKEKMLAGKIDAYLKEKTLLNQKFIKNPDLSIQELLNKEAAIIQTVKYYSI